MKVLFASSEALPFAASGGLAEVSSSLPHAMRQRLIGCRVVMPLYECIPAELRSSMTFLTSLSVPVAWRRQYCGVFEAKVNGVIYYLLDNQYYFKRQGMYGHYDDAERFAFFSRAVLEMLPYIGFRPDVIHCHDWQTGLVPVYLHDSFQQNEFFWGIKTVMTIHNLKFQGVWDVKTVQGITGLSDYYFAPDKLEAYKDANFLKGGIVFADAVTTVSNTYAEEIKTPFYGERLDGLLCARAHDLRGIVNGIDYDVFNPETDKCITRNYNAKTFRKEKVKNKIQLQKDLGLNEDPNAMLIGIVSRLTDQKGFDLIAYVMDELCQDAVQIVVLGTGEERYENMFRHFDWKYHGKVSAQIYYDEPLSHRIYAASDAFLMPSLFEPCGLSQLMSLRYGTLPIVRETGGLKDTVQPYNEFEGTGTGFSFTNYNAHEMLATVRNAERVYYDNKREWNKMVDRAMAADFSWSHSAKQYEEMYNWLIGDK